MPSSIGRTLDCGSKCLGSNPKALIILEINNTLLIKKSFGLSIRISKQSDIVSAYILLNYLLNDSETRFVYICTLGEKSTEKQVKENLFYLRSYTLNNFLNYYAESASLNENKSGFDEDSESANIVG